jgi:hypothetical protein
MANLENVGKGDVESSNVNAHEQWGVLLVIGTAPALAEDTPSIEPAGKAERATAARPKALVPWTQGEAKHEVNVRPQEMPTDGELRPPGRMHEVPLLNAKNMLEVLPQKGEHQRKASPGVKSRHRHERLSESSRRCCKVVGAGPRCCR